MVEFLTWLTRSLAVEKEMPSFVAGDILTVDAYIWFSEVDASLRFSSFSTVDSSAFSCP